MLKSTLRGRRAAHKESLGAQPDSAGLSLREFGRLFSDERMAKHYGKESRDLDTARCATQRPKVSAQSCRT